MRRLYLHAGVHRTATTAIQNYLAQNHSHLVDHGVLFPYNTARHSRLFHDLRTGAKSVSTVAKDLSRRADHKRGSIQSIILSDEDLCCHKSLEFLLPFQDHFEVKFIYALRRQDRWLESWYLQNIKWQWDPELAHITFAEFLQKRGSFHWIDYAAFLAQRAAEFGAENLHLSRFETSVMPQGPIAEFCKLVGLPPPESIQTTTQNESLPPATAELLRYFPLDQAHPKLRQLFERAAFQLQTSPRETSPYLLTPGDRQSILAQYSASNQSVAQKYFNQQTLFQDALPDLNRAPESLTLPDTSHAVLADMVNPLLAYVFQSLNAQYSNKQP